MTSIQAMTYSVEGSEGDDYGASFDLTGKLDLFPDGLLGGHIPCPMMFPFSSEGDVRIVSVITRGEWTDLSANFQLMCTKAGDTFKANARNFFYEGEWRPGACGMFGGKPGLEMHGQWQKDTPPSETGSNATANTRGKFTFKLKPSKDPLPPPPLLIWYQVHVITAHDADEDAAADVALQLHTSHSPDRPSSWMTLTKHDCISKNKQMFQRNQIDSFRVCTDWDEQLISECAVAMKTSADGAGASWQPARVEVMHEASQLWSVFACTDWIPQKNDGGWSWVVRLARSCAPSGTNELLDASQAALTEMQEAHNILQAAHSQLKTQMDEAARDRDMACQEVQEKSDKLVSLQELISELERSAGAAKQEALQAHEAMEKLQLASEEVDRKHVLLEKEHAETLRLLSVAREEALADQKQHQLNQMDLETRLTDSKKECSLLRDTANLTATNAVLAAKLQELQAESAQLNSKISDNEKMRQSASATLEASTLRLEEVRQLCATSTKDIETSNAENDRLERTREDLHARVADAVGGLAALTQRHERAREQAEMLQEIDHKLLMQRNRISALEEKFVLGQTREEKLKDRLHELELAHAELQGQLSSRESTHQSLVFQAAASESESARLASELKKWDTILTNQQERITQAMAKTRVLEEHLVQQHLKMQALSNSNSQKLRTSLKQMRPANPSLQAPETGSKMLELPMLPEFSGGRSESAEHWLIEVAAAGRQHCTDPELVQRAAAALRGRALNWWRSLSTRPSTWEDMRTAICAAFGKTAAGDDLARKKLMALTQAECVPATVEVYVAAFVALARNTGREAMSQADWVQAFVRGISDDAVRKGVQFCSPATLEDATRCAERVLSDRRRHGERPASSSGVGPRVSSLPSSSIDDLGGNRSSGRSAKTSMNVLVAGSASVPATNLSSGMETVALRRTSSALGGRASASSSAVFNEFSNASHVGTRVNFAPAPMREARAHGCVQDGGARRQSQDRSGKLLAGPMPPSMDSKSGKQAPLQGIRSVSGRVGTHRSRLPQPQQAGEGSSPKEVVCFMCGGVNSHPSDACPALNRVLENAQRAADARPRSAARFGSLTASSYNHNAHYGQR